MNSIVGLFIILFSVHSFAYIEMEEIEVRFMMRNQTGHLIVTQGNFVYDKKTKRDQKIKAVGYNRSSGMPLIELECCKTIRTGFDLEYYVSEYSYITFISDSHSTNVSINVGERVIRGVTGEKCHFKGLTIRKIRTDNQILLSNGEWVHGSELETCGTERAGGQELTP